MDVNALLTAGLAPVPISPKTKRPTIKWTQFQHQPPTTDEIARWRINGWVGTICGASAGNLEAIDFDEGGSQFDPWKSCLIEHGYQDLLNRLVIQRTPSGGCHVLYRCPTIAGNQKLAAKDDGGVLIETRGQGGLIVLAPSPGYQWVQGDPTTIPTISPEERSVLLSAARLLDQRNHEIDRPGDAFNDHATWEMILEPQGWTKAGEYRGQILWSRPGKTVKEGWSAKTGDGGKGDFFYCWSTNAGVPSEKALSKFALYAHLNHGGDFGKAAAMLAKEGFGSGERRECRSETPDKEPEIGLPIIECADRSLIDLADEAFHALKSHENLFVRGGILVHLVTDEFGDVSIRDYSEGSLRTALAKTAIYQKTGRSVTRVFPPKEVVQAILARTEYPGVRPLRAVVRTPVGFDLSNGYDKSAAVWVAGNEPWHVASGSAQQSVEFLLQDVLADFPLSSEADRAHALALMLVPLVRHWIDGPTPLHLIDAPVQGTGKSLLARVCLLPTAGRSISTTTATRDEEEWRKRLTSQLKAGRPYIFLDNVSRKLDSDALAAMLLATQWSDRDLGQLRLITLPIHCIWVATANNAELSRDIARRTLWIRLDAQVERPEDRTTFRHPRIEQWVIEHRVEIVGHLLRMIQAWIEAGRPEWVGGGMGGFEAWAGIVGGILQACEVPGFLANISELRAHVDTTSIAWGAFYERWWNLHASSNVLARDLLSVFTEDEQLAALLGDRSEHGQKIAFGALLKKRLGVIANGYRVATGSDRAGVAGFRLEKVEDQPKTNQDQPQTNQANQVQMVGLGWSFGLKSSSSRENNEEGDSTDIILTRGGKEKDQTTNLDQPFEPELANTDQPQTNHRPTIDQPQTNQIVEDWSDEDDPWA